MRFVKMHGAGNDYVYVDGFTETVDDPVALARAVSDRHFGIGGDGLILVLPSAVADVRMRMFNLDGSESAMCGNGVRCVAKYALEAGYAPGPGIRVETGRGVLDLVAERDAAGRVSRVTVDMGPPILEPARIPFLGTGADRIVNHPYSAGGLDFRITALSMGNPHCVVFVDRVADYPVAEHGPLLENSAAFPERTNVEFVERVGERAVRIRTWERGSGETLACGTGASAVCAALKLNFGTGGPLTAHLAGGDLELEWVPAGSVMMTGPAVEVFRGEYLPG